MPWQKILSLVIGSIAGGFACYALAGWVQVRADSVFPYGTLIVNLTGCLLIGFFDSLMEYKYLMTPNDRILLMTGFCGAFTTFSTFILETSNLWKDGEKWPACANILASITLGVIVFRLGSMLGRAI